MKLHYHIFLLAAAILAIQACDDAANPVLENAYYLNEAASGSLRKVILNEIDGGDVSATVRSGRKLDADVKVRLTLSQEALDDYNALNGTDFRMLPASSHDFVECETVIKAGQSMSERLDIHVKPYTEEMQASGIKYALPISISSVSDDGLLLDVKKTMIYSFEQVIVTSGFQINAMSSVWRPLANPLYSNTYTLELRVAPRGLDRENEAFFMVYPYQEANSGLGEIYCRFQKDNSLNIKVHYNENYTWAGPITKKWYHIALVCTGDGNLITYVNGSEVMRENKPSYATPNCLEKIAFGAATSTWHFNSYCYSEVRLWSKARSQSQIADNMYAVDPASEGLVAYWRCNEGEGTMLHDCSGNGNDIDLETCLETVASSTENCWQWMGPVRSDTDELLDL